MLRISSLILTLLAAGPAGVRPSERRVVAYQLRDHGFVTRGTAPFADFYEEGFGQATIEASETTAADGKVDRSVRASAQFLIGADRYGVELSLPGRGLAAGTVAFDRDVHGRTGLGSPAMPTVHAAVAAWGQGRVTRNGEILSDRSQIEVMALTASAHAADATNRLLPQALEGRQEIEVLAEGLPPSIVPNGFLQFSFDSVQVENNGRPIAAEPSSALIEAQTNQGPSQSVSAYAGGALLGAPPPAGVGMTSPTPANPIESSPGILATPSVEAPGTVALPSTPSPVNSQPALPLAPGIAPLNTVPGGIAPANAQPAHGAAVPAR